MIPRRVVVFGLLCVVTFVVIGTDAYMQLVTLHVAAFMASLVEPILGCAGVQAAVDGSLIVVPQRMQMRISADCVAMPAYATLISLEAALGRRIRSAVVLVGLAFLTFFVINTVRVSSLALAWLFAHGWYEFLHEIAWNGILFVIVTGYVWLRIRRELGVAISPQTADTPSMDSTVLARRT